MVSLLALNDSPDGVAHDGVGEQGRSIEDPEKNESFDSRSCRDWALAAAPASQDQSPPFREHQILLQCFHIFIKFISQF